VDAKTTREDVRTVAALPALLPIVVITARPPPKGRDGGLRSNISALFVLRGNTQKTSSRRKMVIPKPSFFSLRSLINCTPFFASSSSKRERERRELFVVA